MYSSAPTIVWVVRRAITRQWSKFVCPVCLSPALWRTTWATMWVVETPKKQFFASDLWLCFRQQLSHLWVWLSLNMIYQSNVPSYVRCCSLITSNDIILIRCESKEEEEKEEEEEEKWFQIEVVAFLRLTRNRSSFLKSANFHISTVRKILAKWS